jgi:hypothetical protein
MVDTKDKNIVKPPPPPKGHHGRMTIDRLAFVHLYRIRLTEQPGLTVKALRDELRAEWKTVCEAAVKAGQLKDVHAV